MSIFQDIYKNNKDFLKEATKFVNQTSKIYYNTLYENMTINTFEWDGLNENFRKQWVEILLYFYPYVAAFEDKGEIKIFPCSANGQILENSFYSDYVMYAPNGNVYYRKFEDIEILFNNTLGVSSYVIQKPIIDALTETFSAIRQNIRRSKVGSIIGVEDEGKVNLVFDAIRNAVEDDDIIKIVQNTTFGDGIKSIPIFDNRMADITSLWETHSQFKSMIQTDLGFASIDVFKRERLTERESKAGSEIAEKGIVNDMLNNRKDFCERCNKHFGTNYSCDIRRDYSEEDDIEKTFEEGGDNNEDNL